MHMLLDAIKFAAERHAGQFRRGTGEPYVTHPIAVSYIVATYKRSKHLIELLVAAVLHDILEDTDTTFEELAARFSPLVASLVLELKNDDEQIALVGKLEYQSRKLKGMSSYGLLIKLADRLHNISDQPTKKMVADTLELMDRLVKARRLSKSQKELVDAIVAQCHAKQEMKVQPVRAAQAEVQVAGTTSTKAVGVLDVFRSALSEEGLPAFEDPAVQLVYAVLCSEEAPPNREEHWEGWAARRVVAMLRAFSAPSVEQPPIYEVKGVCESLAQAGFGDLMADVVRSRAKYPGNARMFDALIGELDELRRAYGGEGDVRAEALDVATVAYRLAMEGDSGGNVHLNALRDLKRDGRFLTVTTTQDGEVVLVSWQDEDHQILDVVWSASARAKHRRVNSGLAAPAPSSPASSTGEQDTTREEAAGTVLSKALASSKAFCGVAANLFIDCLRGAMDGLGMTDGQERAPIVGYYVNELNALLKDHGCQTGPGAHVQFDKVPYDRLVKALIHAMDSAEVADLQLRNNLTAMYVRRLDELFRQFSQAQSAAQAPQTQAVDLVKPAPQSQWRHQNGNRYKVLGLTNEHTERPDAYPVTVVYQGDNGRIWSRNLSDWHRSMTPDTE